eukprot:gene18463-100_t
MIRWLLLSFAVLTQVKCIFFGEVTLNPGNDWTKRIIIGEPYTVLPLIFNSVLFVFENDEAIAQ